ncbi:ABC transporter C family member [Arachis hypogaea]|nr:ABC transporter C family member [Arachis hypogaea]
MSSGFLTSTSSTNASLIPNSETQTRSSLSLPLESLLVHTHRRLVAPLVSSPAFQRLAAFLGLLLAGDRSNSSDRRRSSSSGFKYSPSRVAVDRRPFAVDTIDGYSRPQFNSSGASTWLCFRLDILSSITFAFSVICLMVVPQGVIDPENCPSPSWPSYGEVDICNLQVAMATAAKAKLLLCELKTVKADLAFAKARCSKLEEENKMLRDCGTTTTKGQNREDDDMIRFQLETLLAEKARLAGENEVYARENRFPRELVEYHQLTMQDVVYLDDGIAEVPEVYDSSSGVSRITSFNPSPSESPLRVVIRNSESSPILPNEMLTVIEKDSKSASENEAPIPSVSASPK